MSTKELTLSGWFGALCLLVAAFVYIDNTGSQHAATNPDEYLYLQITRLTADTGHLLPLQATKVKHRNTKPPGLFWQGIASTDWGKHWELWRLRVPNALYSLATALTAFLIARKLGGGFANGAIAALAYLAFLGVYRHGRVFLTSAPETFWLFLPFFLLLMTGDPRRIDWRQSFVFGLSIGLGLLCKSFAMVLPVLGALAWWTWKERGRQTAAWFKKDVPKLAMTGVIALAVFGIWFLMDPQRGLILGDFILKENVGKFDAGGSYIANSLAGKHSIWAYTLGWLSNAGLAAPAVIAVFALAWRSRRHLPAPEQLLWIWIIVLFVFHLLPDVRYERYLLPAMPAVAVLCGLYWERIPRWVLVVMLIASGAVSLALFAGAITLGRILPGTPLYGAVEWVLLVAVPLFCILGAVARNWTRAFALPAILLVYGGFTAFLRPFDGPLGNFSAEAVGMAAGRKVVAPSVFYGKDELTRFLLPGANVRGIREKDLEAAKASEPEALFIVQVPVAGDGTGNIPDGSSIVAKRLTLRDYYSPAHMSDMARGHLANNVFVWDLLLERGRSAGSPAGQQ